jgi:RimJ/RimL family protein N-acetyltransferase
MPPFPPTIAGKQVTLRWLHPSFFPAYHQMFSSIVRAALHLPLTAPFEVTQDFLQQQLDGFTTMDLFYCIFDNTDNKLIGAIKIRDPHSEEAAQHGQLGVWVNEKHWGHNRYQEALALATQAYFAHAKVESIGAFIDETNQRSLRAHTKFGFVITGTAIGCCNAAESVKHTMLKLTRSPMQ